MWMWGARFSLRRASARYAACAALSAFSAHAEALFNGKDLTGWQFLGAPGAKGFEVENGLLRTGGAKGMIWYTGRTIGDSKIRLMFRMSNEKGNSGVFIRIPGPPKSEADAIHKGIEVQIDNRDDDWHCTGVLYSMTKAKARPSKAPGEWNTMEITLDGLRTLVHVNAILVTDYDGVSAVPERTKSYEPERRPRPASGYIGIQNHDQSAIIYFKDISVETLKK